MDSRAEFESIAGASGFHDFEVSGNGCYCDDFLQHFYSGWQASRQWVEGEPVMWSLQFDSGPINHFTTYPTLEKAEDYVALCSIGKDKSNIKIIPLYTHPASAVPDAEYIRALKDAFDIIQADANTEQNYGSLCRMGWVLANIKANQEQGHEPD